MPVAILTGAAAGIGRATALTLAARGWQLVLGDVDGPALEQVAGLAGDGAVAVAGDLTEDAALAALIATAAEKGELTAVVHCAALFPRLALSETTLAQYDRVLGVNLRAAVAITLCATRAIRRGGSLVFLTSGSGLQSAATDPFQRGFALYGASKAALDRWVAGVASELLEAGIAASTITPGAFVRTAGLARAGVEPPPGAATIEAEQVAEAIVRLVEDRDGTFAGRRLSAATFGQDWH